MFLTREAGSGWLRGINCVSFYLRLHASWIQRRARKSGGNFECRVGRRREKKRFHTAPSKTRTDTFTYFSAPPLSLSYSLFLFLSLSHRPHAFILRCFIQTTNSRNLLAIYVFRYRREQMVPRLPPRFYDALYLRALIDSRVPQNFHFLFRGVKNNVGSYE